MGVAIKIDDLTTAEKIDVMERLWDDLCHNASETLSPAWHGDLLARREKNIDEGDASFMDWDAAKKSIREST